MGKAHITAINTHPAIENFKPLWLGPCRDSAKRASPKCKGTTSVVPLGHSSLFWDFSPERSLVLDPIQSPDRQSSRCTHWPFQRAYVLRRSPRYRFCGLHNLLCLESHDMRTLAAISLAKSSTPSPPYTNTRPESVAQLALRLFAFLV